MVTHTSSLPSTTRRALAFASIGALALTLAACATPDTTASAVSESTQAPAAQWSYTGANGPEHWGEVGAACENTSTSHESPIAIDTTTLATHPSPTAVIPDYHPADFDLENNGHTIEAIPIDTDENAVIFQGTRYTLQQFHFHATSEHIIDGVPAAAELHLVHKAPDESLLVLGVLLQPGATNTELTEIFHSLPATVSDEGEALTQKVNPSRLLPDTRASVQYDGSLTTPPCSEGVQWNVYLTPVTISDTQLNNFTTLYPDNHRPTQPLHDRTLTHVGPDKG